MWGGHVCYELAIDRSGMGGIFFLSNILWLCVILVNGFWVFIFACVSLTFVTELFWWYRDGHCMHSSPWHWTMTTQNSPHCKAQYSGMPWGPKWSPKWFKDREGSPIAKWCYINYLRKNTMGKWCYFGLFPGEGNVEVSMLLCLSNNILYTFWRGNYTNKYHIKLAFGWLYHISRCLCIDPCAVYRPIVHFLRNVLQLILSMEDGTTQVQGLGGRALGRLSWEGGWGGNAESNVFEYVLQEKTIRKGRLDMYISLIIPYQQLYFRSLVSRLAVWRTNLAIDPFDLVCLSSVLSISG